MALVSTHIHSVASVGLPDPEKIRRRLGSHFHHKIAVMAEEHRTLLDFGIGTCELHSVGASLHFSCAADTERDLLDIERTLERHMSAMAPQTRGGIHWQRES
jgi:hypothetical protein